MAHVTTCRILYICLAYLRRVNAYESVGALCEGIVAELVEKNLAQRLGELFEELLQMVITAVADSGSGDLAQFPRSAEYAALQTLFAESFLDNQL